MVWLIIVSGILLLLLWMAISPFSFELQFKKEGVNDGLRLRFRIGGLPLLELNIPSVHQRLGLKFDLSLDALADSFSLNPEQLIKIKGPFDILKNIYDNTPAGLGKLIIKLISELINKRTDFLKKVQCQEWKWITEVGLTNPALTGILTGVLWDLKHRLYRYFTENTAGMANTPVFAVVPHFCESKFDLEFHCIFAFRGGHIITATCRMWWLRLSSLMRG